jgi:hypothetical protein
MALFTAKNQALQIPSPPNLPLAAISSPDRLYLDQLNNVMRLYFTQMSNAVSSVAGDEGGQYLSFSFGSFYDTTTQTAGATSTSYELVDESMTEVYSGWTYRNLSMACVGFGKIFRDS